MKFFHSLVIVVIYFQVAVALNPHFSLCLDKIQQKDMSHINNSNMYCGTNEDKIVLEELHKLWKLHTNHLRKMHKRNEHKDVPSGNNNLKFEVRQLVMIKDHANCTLEPKYLVDYRVQQILNDNTHLLVTPGLLLEKKGK